MTSNWADARVDDDEDEYGSYTRDLPPPTSHVEGNTKITREYKYDDETGVLKMITRYYRIEKLKVSKSIAARKNWKKYGKAKDDPPGPNPANTVVCEDVFIQFISVKDEEKGYDAGRDIDMQNLTDKSVVKCRNCGMDHWTLKCPYKEKLDVLKERDGGPGNSAGAAMDSMKDMDKKTGGKYVPPSMREGASKMRSDNSYPKSSNEANTIRITNLPEDIQDSDIRDLITPLSTSKITRIFLAKDKYTGQSKGFAFVSFDRKEDAFHVIKILNGYGYANLILNVEWAKPSAN